MKPIENFANWLAGFLLESRRRSPGTKVYRRKRGLRK